MVAPPSRLVERSCTQDEEAWGSIPAGCPKVLGRLLIPYCLCLLSSDEYLVDDICVWVAPAAGTLVWGVYCISLPGQMRLLKWCVPYTRECNDCWRQYRYKTLNDVLPIFILFTPSILTTVQCHHLIMLGWLFLIYLSTTYDCHRPPTILFHFHRHVSRFVHVDNMLMILLTAGHLKVSVPQHMSLVSTWWRELLHLFNVI